MRHRVEAQQFDWSPTDEKCCRKRHHCHDDITCREAAKSVYELACAWQELMEEYKQLHRKAECLIEKAFKLAKSIEESC